MKIIYGRISAGQPIQLVERGSYTETSRLLETGDIDAVFVCSGPYGDGKERFGMQLYIIVPADSPARTFDYLRGKVFAFTAPKSNTGKLAPTFMKGMAIDGFVPADDKNCDTMRAMCGWLAKQGKKP